MGPSAYAVMFG
jgi:hypothetical protein